MYSFAPLQDVTEEDFHKHFNINVLGILLTTQAALPHLSEGASIINLGSSITSISPPNTVVYTATKGAVDSITAVLANELAPKKIRVNSINPGLVETEGTHSAGVMGSDFENHLVSKTPLGRFGKTADISKVALFLASEDAGWLTGEHILASGGLR